MAGVDISIIVSITYNDHDVPDFCQRGVCICVDDVDVDLWFTDHYDE
jgi:hypothetical protein